MLLLFNFPFCRVSLLSLLPSCLGWRKPDQVPQSASTIASSVVNQNNVVGLTKHKTTAGTVTSTNKAAQKKPVPQQKVDMFEKWDDDGSSNIKDLNLGMTKALSKAEKRKLKKAQQKEEEEGQLQSASVSALASTPQQPSASTLSSSSSVLPNNSTIASGKRSFYNVLFSIGISIHQ
eukprot:Awhi_evm1s4640